MLAGRAGTAGPEVTDLLRVAAQVRDLPSEAFRAKLRSDLIDRVLKEKKMSPTLKSTWIREGFHSITPYLHAPAEAKLMEFLKSAFGGKERFRAPRPDGTIMHGEVTIGDTIVEMADVLADFESPKATALWYFVPDVDAVYQRALDAGAVSLSKPVDQTYGDREAGIRDPAGNVWFISRRSNVEGYKSPGQQDVAPYLFPRGGAAFLDFLVKAFGAEVTSRHDSPEGAVVHATVKLGDSTIGMGEAQGQWQPMPGGFHYYVPDVDAVYRRAVEVGGKAHTAPADQPYGDRYACVIDPQGNYWYLATHLPEQH